MGRGIDMKEAGLVIQNSLTNLSFLKLKCLQYPSGHKTKLYYENYQQFDRLKIMAARQNTCKYSNANIMKGKRSVVKFM